MWLLKMVTIKKMTEDDIEAVTEIYNEAIVSTTATFDIEPKSLKEQRKWFFAHDTSIHLFRSFGFETVGTLREVGFKFGRYHDIITLQMFF